MNVLILGGVGFVGRNLVNFLVGQDDVAKIKVLDKVLPVTAFLSEEHAAAFENPKVLFKQTNLSSPKSIEDKMTPEGDEKWDVIVNLAAETKYGQTEEVYKEKVLDVCKKCVDHAVKLPVGVWVEVSTGQVYDAGKKPSSESAKQKPWTKLAKFKLDAEKYVLEQTAFKKVVLRPAIIYGPGDNAGIAPRLIIGAVYQHLAEKQKNLWGKDLGLNTVHVVDVCRAIWHVAQKADDGAVFNVVDKNQTTQGKVNELVSEIFGIKCGYFGTMASSLAKTIGLKGIAEEANEKHLKPWSELCRASGIDSTPLSPYMDQELLYNNSLSLDGSAIEATGFELTHPNLTREDCDEIIGYFSAQGLFPKTK